MLSSFDLSAFPASRSDVVRFLGIDFLALMKLLHVYLLSLTRLLCIDLLAFAGLHTFFFIIVIVISQEESLECRCILIVGGQGGSGFAFIIFKNPKIFYPNNFVLLFDICT